MHISIHENVQPPLWHLSNQLKTVQSQSIFWIFLLLQFCQFRVAYLSAVASLADSAGQPSVAARWLARPIPCPARQSQVWSPAQHHQPPTLLYISCIARRSCLPRPSPPAQLQAPTPSLKISTAPPRAAGLLYATLASAIFIGVSDLHAPPMPGKVQGRHEKAAGGLGAGN